ncbi:MAG: MarR family winged helix-turn-helix transcriptional regulator [Thermoleophilia bacterium]
MVSDTTLLENDPVEKARQQWVRTGKPNESGFVVLVSMLRSYSLLIRELEAALRPIELTLSRFEVLLLLSFTRNERLPSMRLRDLLMVSGSSATYLIDKLEAGGLVERESDPSDRRVNVVHLTKAGRAAVEQGVEALSGIGFGSIRGMDEAGRRALADSLAALRGARPPRIGEGHVLERAEENGGVTA